MRHSKRLHKPQHLRRMPRRLQPAPALHQLAIHVEHKRAALDAAHLLAVHVLQLHHAEQFADFFIGVGEQFEREAELGLEAFVRFQAVARDADDDRVGLAEVGVQVAELLAFEGAAGGVVLGVEIDDDVLAAMVGQLEWGVAGGGQFEIGDDGVAHGGPFFFNVTRI